MELELLPMGERAILAEVSGTAQVLALATALADVRSGSGEAPAWAQRVTEVVPAARTLLLRVDGREDLPTVREGMSQLAATVEAREEGRASEGGQSGDQVGGGQSGEAGEQEGRRSGGSKSRGDTGGEAAGRAAAGETVVVPVTYDGPDLAEVAGLTGLDEEEVVRAHTEAVYRVAFIGFAPGFAYLAGGDPRLSVPRRSTPRSAVPVGSVGLAGEFTGVYPRASPGGWQLIGRTEATLWDVDREPPALLVPGAQVRFEVAP